MPIPFESRRPRFISGFCLLACVLTAACRQFDASVECLDEDACGHSAKVCEVPTVKALACDLDHLERHIEWYGSVVAQSPSVWGQARMTKHRQEFEDYMAAELGNFGYSIQGSSARTDQAFFQEAFYLSSVASSAAAPGGSGGSGGGCGLFKSAPAVSFSTAIAPPTTGTTALPGVGTIATTASPPSATLNAAKLNPSALNSSTLLTAAGAINPSATLSSSPSSGSPSSSSQPASGSPSSSSPSSASGSPTDAPSLANAVNGLVSQTISRTPVGTVTGPTYSFRGGPVISIEPEVYLDQKARYLNYLHELRRINEGDDTADSPGYALNLIRFPVSVLPGKCTEAGHGAEITMTLTPHLNPDLLPTTFRSLVLNDLVEQISYPITQFINNPGNDMYLNDTLPGGHSGEVYSDVTSLLRFVDDNLPRLLMLIREPVSKTEFECLLTSRGSQLPEQVKSKLFTAYNDLDLYIRQLRTLRLRLSLQCVFQSPEWYWVDELLRASVIAKDQLDRVTTRLKATPNLDGQKLHSELKDYYQSDNAKQSNQLLAKAYQAISLNVTALVSATKSRRASLPFPPSQMVEVYGFALTYELAIEAYRGLSKERFARSCVESNRDYYHMPDVQGLFQEEILSVYKMLADPQNDDLWRLFSLQDLATAVRSHHSDWIRETRAHFRRCMYDKFKIGGTDEGGHSAVSDTTIALAWAYLVESALLTEQLARDMQESAAAKGCACPPNCWLDYFMPCPSADARAAFNQYVKCRWPIHVFALDPAAQQQNLSDVYSSRREMQLAMSLAFVTGQISASNMMSYARRIEVDMATVDLNNTAVGFSHGENTFGWRFYPRFQNPDIESNFTVLFRDMLIGGPKKNALLRQRRLEPGIRECVAVVMMPSFVPYADLSVNSNWFCLTNPKKKLLDAECAMKLSKAVKTIETCSCNVTDANCYRDGDLGRLMDKAKQLSERLPYQSASVQIPYENTIGGFAMFNTGVTDLAPELTGWYGSPSINPCHATTVFLVGNHFSVHQTRVIAGGREIPPGLDDSTSGYGTSEMLSRQVIKVVIPPYPQVVGSPGRPNERFVDVQLATPYGISQHLLIPVCGPASQGCAPTPSPAAAAATPVPTVISPPPGGPAIVVPQGSTTPVTPVVPATMPPAVPAPVSPAPTPTPASQPMSSGSLSPTPWRNAAPIVPSGATATRPPGGSGEMFSLIPRP